jgi:hypothetical protein
MSLPSCFAGATIARCIALVMKRHGKSGIDPTAAAHALWLKTHPLPAISDKARVEDPTSAVVNNSERRKVRHDRPPRKQGSNCETKPIEKVATPQ